MDFSAEIHFRFGISRVIGGGRENCVVKHCGQAGGWGSQGRAGRTVGGGTDRTYNLLTNDFVSKTKNDLEHTYELDNSI